MDTIQQVVSETFSREADRILAALIGTVRDFELAEDALQDALLVALERWSVVECVGSAALVAAAVEAMHTTSVWAEVMALSRTGMKNVPHARSPLNNSMSWFGRMSA